jgi:predicted small secreted protein
MKKSTLILLMVLALLAAVGLSACGTCDWQATTCPIQEFEKGFFPQSFDVLSLLALTLLKVNPRRVNWGSRKAKMLLLALAIMAFVLLGCGPNVVATGGDPAVQGTQVGWN